MLSTVIVFSLVGAFLFQHKSWIVSGVIVNIIGQSLVVAYPSCLLPGLRAAGSSIKADLNVLSWIASTIGITMTVGLFIFSYLMARFGRRRIHAVSLIPCIIGCILIYFATNATTILIGRMLQGLGMGGALVVGSTSIGEYSDPRYRGIFLNLKCVATVLGALVMHVLVNIHWRSMALIISVPFMVSFVITLTWPESPSWLISKKRFKESEQAFSWLRGESENSVNEFRSMVKAQKDRIIAQDDVANCGTFTYLLKTFTRRDFYKPVIIVFFCFVIMETTGRHFFPTYALDIIGDITGDRSQIFIYTISIDVITLLSTMMATIMVKVFRRRTLLFFSGIASIVVLTIICLYLFFVSIGYLSNDRQWIPLSLLVFYFVIVSTGCTSIPFTLYGEVFPLPHRGLGTSVGGATMSLSMVICLKVTPYMLTSLKVYGTFAVFNVVTAISLLYLYFALPETKNRTLQEIEHMFNHGKFADVNINEDVDESAQFVTTTSVKIK